MNYRTEGDYDYNSLINRLQKEGVKYVTFSQKFKTEGRKIIFTNFWIRNIVTY